MEAMMVTGAASMPRADTASSVEPIRRAVGVSGRAMRASSSEGSEARAGTGAAVGADEQHDLVSEVQDPQGELGSIGHAELGHSGPDVVVEVLLLEEGLAAQPGGRAVEPDHGEPARRMAVEGRGHFDAVRLAVAPDERAVLPGTHEPSGELQDLGPQPISERTCARSPGDTSRIPRASRRRIAAPSVQPMRD